MGSISDGPHSLISSKSTGVPYYPDGYNVGNNMVVARSARRDPHCPPSSIENEASSNVKDTVSDHGYEHEHRGTKFPFQKGPKCTPTNLTTVCLGVTDLRVSRSTHYRL